MTIHRHKLPDKIAAALDATGLPWSVEPGSHTKIRLNGRLVGVCSHSKNGHHDRAVKAVVSQIRRAARGDKP